MFQFNLAHIGVGTNIISPLIVYNPSAIHNDGKSNLAVVTKQPIEKLTFKITKIEDNSFFFKDNKCSFLIGKRRHSLYQKPTRFYSLWEVGRIKRKPVCMNARKKFLMIGKRFKIKRRI